MKISVVLFLTAVMAAFSASAQASIVAYEGFNGGIIGQDASATAATGIGFNNLDSGTTSFRMNTEAGLSYLNLQVTGNSAGMTETGVGGTKNLHLQFSSALPTTGTIWSSYLMQIGGAGGTNVNSFGVVSGMTTSSAGGISSGLSGQEAVWRSNSTNWGIFGAAGIDERTGPDSTPDATVNFFLVNSYNLDNGTLTSYLNPSDLTDVVGTATHTISEAATAGNFAPFTHFAFSLGGGAQPTGLIDEIRVGTTLADVTPINAVPEPSGLALLGLCGGLGLLKRRRR